MMFASGCTTVGPADTYCLIAKPIWVSENDVITVPTARQIYEHNETGAALCQWGR